MVQRLPPLNSLRAFEAAGRHRSFKDAARELNVTPAAIGHQIKKLEADTGVRLFDRLNRSVRLTEAGRACLPDLKDGFEKLAAAVEVLISHGRRDALTLTVAPSFAAKWLIPRLHRFQDSHPEFAVRLDTNMAELELFRAGIDLGIRFGSGNYPGLRVDRLMEEELFPVCSPELLRGQCPLRWPNDLHHATLLHIEGETQDATWVDWPTWLESANCVNVDGTSGLRFTQSLMAVQAAIEGQGVALAPSSIVADDLRAGRLVKLFSELPAAPATFAYFIVSPQEVAAQPKVVAFREFLIAEAIRATQELERGFSGTGKSMTMRHGVS